MKIKLFNKLSYEASCTFKTVLFEWLKMQAFYSAGHSVEYNTISY